MVNFRPRARDVWAGRGGAEGCELPFSAGRTSDRVEGLRARWHRSRAGQWRRPGATGLARRGQTGSEARSQARGQARRRGELAHPIHTLLSAPAASRARVPTPRPAARRLGSPASRRCLVWWAQESSNPRPAVWEVWFPPPPSSKWIIAAAALGSWKWRCSFFTCSF